MASMLTPPLYCLLYIEQRKHATFQIAWSGFPLVEQNKKEPPTEAENPYILSGGDEGDRTLGPPFSWGAPCFAMPLVFLLTYCYMLFGFWLRSPYGRGIYSTEGLRCAG